MGKRNKRNHKAVNPSAPYMQRMTKESYYEESGHPYPLGVVRLDSQYMSGGKIRQSAKSTDIYDEYEASSWLQAAIRKKSWAVADAPWRLMKVVKDGQDEMVTDHPLIDLLYRPSKHPTFNTWQKMIATVVSFMDLKGRMYLEKVRTKNGDVVELVPLRPDRVEMQIHPAEGLQGFTYKASAASAKGRFIAPKDVLIFSYFDPVSPFGGVAPAMSVLPAAQMDRAADDWNGGFFKRGAVPDGIIETDVQIAPAEQARLKAEFTASNSVRSGNGRKVYVLPKGVRFNETSKTHREMQFDRLQTAMRDKIISAIGVPPVMLGLTESSNYATASVQKLSFRDDTLKPLLRLILASFQSMIEDDFDGEDLYLDIDEERMKLPEERSRDVTGIEQHFSLGLIDKAEARARLGYPPEKEDDILEGPEGKDVEDDDGQPSARTKVEDEEQQPPPPTSAPATGSEGEASPSIPAQKRESRTKRLKKVDNESSDDEDGHAAIVTTYRLEKAREPVRKKLERALSIEAAKRLTIQRKRVMDWLAKKFGEDPLRKAEGDKPEPAPKKPITEKELRDVLQAPITRAMRDAVYEASKLGGDTQSQVLGVAFNAEDPSVVEYLDKHVTKLEDVLDETTARGVKDTILQGYKDDLTYSKIAEKIWDSGDFSPSRANRIANTEIHQAIQAGSYAGMGQAGAEKVKWMSAADAQVRPSHAEANGQIVDYGEPFEVGDDELMFPGDPNGDPSETVNCRCVMSPVFEPVTQEEVAEALEYLEDKSARPDANDKAIDLVESAIRTLPDSTVSTMDPDAVARLKLSIGEGDTVSYDTGKKTLTVGPKARKEELRNAVSQHFVASIMTEADATGFFNQLKTGTDLKFPKTGTDDKREKAVRILSAIVGKDHDLLNEYAGKKLDDEEVQTLEMLGQHFWMSGGRKISLPAR